MSNEYQRLPEYNGWSNKPTWEVKLWMDNDYNEYHYWLDRTIDLIEWGGTEYDLENALKEYFDDCNPLADQANVYSGLLSWALAYINWREIAEVMISEANEVIEEEA